MKNLKTVISVIAALAMTTPAVSAFATTPAQPQSYPYYQDREHNRDRRLDRRHWDREQRDRRHWDREQHRRYERYQRERERYRVNNSSFFNLAAGIIIGSIIVDQYGDRRQYYYDRRGSQYYYYDYQTRRYYWDPQYRSYEYRYRY